MDLEFLSDPLLKGALYLSVVLFCGIGFLFYLICRKHYFRLKRSERFELCSKLLTQYVNKQTDESQLISIKNKISTIAQKNPIDFFLMWSWMLEHCNASEKILYEKLANEIQLYRAIRFLLNSRSNDSRCIALSIVGLAGLHQHIQDVVNLCEEKPTAQFACHALVRIQRTKAISTLLDAHKNDLINTGQLMMCFSELSEAEVESWELTNPQIKLPPIILNYLWSNQAL